MPIDARADIYALGVMFFMLLNGTPPARSRQPLDVELPRSFAPAAPAPTPLPQVAIRVNSDSTITTG